MAIKKKKTIHWLFVIFEIILFIVSTILLSYFSGIQAWNIFWIISVISGVLFIVLKIFENNEKLKESLYFDDFASKISKSAISSGLCSFYNMQNLEEQATRNKDCQETINNSNTFYLCANSGASYLDSSVSRHWQVIEKQLIKGKMFKVVLLDPYSDNQKQRNKLNVNGGSDDSRLNVANLINLSNKFPSLEIKFIKNGMYSTIFTTDKSLFFDPYHIGVIGSQIESRTFCLRFELTNNEKDLYTIFQAHFDSIWKEGTSLKKWIKNSKKNLSSDLPILN